MEKYVVIKESELNTLKAYLFTNNIQAWKHIDEMSKVPAQEMWDACKDCWMIGEYDDRAKIHHEYPTLESFLKTKA